MRISPFLFAVIATASQTTHAGSEALALQFIELLRYGSQFEEAHALCLKSNSAMPPEKILNITPENPGPIPPGSRLWPQVVAAYDEYWKDLCAHPTREEFLGIVAKSYARNLTDQELSAIIQFYSSPTGSKLVAANSAAVRELYVEYQRLAAQNLQPASAKLNKTLESLGEAAAAERCRERASLKSAAGVGCAIAGKPNG